MQVSISVKVYFEEKCWYYCASMPTNNISYDYRIEEVNNNMHYYSCSCLNRKRKETSIAGTTLMLAIKALDFCVRSGVPGSRVGWMPVDCFRAQMGWTHSRQHLMPNTKILVIHI